MYRHTLHTCTGLRRMFLTHLTWKPACFGQHFIPAIRHEISSLASNRTSYWDNRTVQIRHYGQDNSSESSREVRPDRLAHSDKNASHWLDHLFHGALRDYLEDAMRRWWIHGLITDRCNSYKELQGIETQWLKEALERQFHKYQDKYADRVVDSRSRLHVSIASLVLASNACLKPFLKDDSLIEKIISEHMGSRTAPALEYGKLSVLI